MYCMEHRPWSCERCGNVIGVYEPVVVVEGADKRVSSRLLLERAERTKTGLRYHEACWLLSHD